MTYSVSSSFVDNTLLKTSSPVRKLFIGSDDYSDRVIKWPKVAKEWDNPKPVTITLDLANGDKAMNFLRVDKTKLTSECLVQMGYPLTTAGEWLIETGVFTDTLYDIHYLDDIPTSFWFSPDGLILMHVGAGNDKIYKHTLTQAWDLRTATFSGYDFYIGSESLVPYGSWWNEEGTIFYVVDGTSNIVYQYTLTSAWDLTTISYASKSFDTSTQVVAARGMSLGSNGTKLYVGDVGDDDIHQYTLSTAYDISTATYDTKLLDVTPKDSAPLGIQFNSTGTYLIVAGQNSNFALKYTLSTPWDISTATFTSSLDLTPTAGAIYHIFVDPTGDNLWTLINHPSFDHISKFRLVNDELITIFGGDIDSIKYSKGKCSIRIADKMKQLSERLVGDRDTPVTYTNQLLSDVGWDLVTTYGGYDATTSTANPDIDWTQFMEWASVMSGDTINVSANFEGVKVTECLRKIARMSHSAIYIEDNKLVFSRFSVLNDPDAIVVDDEMILDSVLTVNNSDIINKQFVNAGYNVTSKSFAITISEVLSASVNSFGVREHVEEDTSIWYTTSASAINLAQRKLFTQGEPVDRITAKTPLTTLTKQIGDTITYSNTQQEVNENFKIMRRGLDMNRCAIDLMIDRSQLVNPFYLDVTSLDGSEVLT